MTKGTKNYFRHIFNASDDIGINGLFNKMGHKGYAYYFLLVELLSQIEAQENCQGEYEIHPRVLAMKLRTRAGDLHNILRHMQDHLQMNCITSCDKVKISYPNILKYMGSYNGFKQINETIKLNKTKLNKTKEKHVSSVDDVSILSAKEVIEHWNGTAPDAGLAKVSTKQESDRYKKLCKKVKSLLKTVDTLDKWSKVFNVTNTKRFKNKDGSEFIPSIDTALVHAEKYLAEYDSSPEFNEPEISDEELFGL